MVNNLNKKEGGRYGTNTLGEMTGEVARLRG